MRVALLGGSFNPPHVGHLMAAQWVLASQPVDQLWLMPAFAHPFRKALLRFETRVQLCEAAIEGVPGMAVTRLEAEVGRGGWTFETLEHLREVRPDIQPSLVVGSDLMFEKHKWNRFERVLELCTLIVVNRAGWPAPEAQGPVLAEISSTEIRRRLAEGLPLEGWLPRGVARRIEAERLYR